MTQILSQLAQTVFDPYSGLRGSAPAVTEILRKLYAANLDGFFRNPFPQVLPWDIQALSHLAHRFAGPLGTSPHRIALWDNALGRIRVGDVVHQRIVGSPHRNLNQTVRVHIDGTWYDLTKLRCHELEICAWDTVNQAKGPRAFRLPQSMSRTHHMIEERRLIALMAQSALDLHRVPTDPRGHQTLCKTAADFLDATGVRCTMGTSPGPSQSLAILTDGPSWLNEYASRLNRLGHAGLFLSTHEVTGPVIAHADRVGPFMTAPWRSLGALAPDSVCLHELVHMEQFHARKVTVDSLLNTAVRAPSPPGSPYSTYSISELYAYLAEVKYNSEQLRALEVLPPSSDWPMEATMIAPLIGAHAVYGDAALRTERMIAAKIELLHRALFAAQMAERFSAHARAVYLKVLQHGTPIPAIHGQKDRHLSMGFGDMTIDFECEQMHQFSQLFGYRAVSHEDMVANMRWALERDYVAFDVYLREIEKSLVSLESMANAVLGSREDYLLRGVRLVAA